MKVKWKIHDGYEGKRRSHFIDIPDDEFEE